ncbi:LysR family transcriptional regulator [Pantoea dispersa]|uniref:LysR family transcriptional regulator n=1 Tax=Pantoea dispersa TaxID=59814 RepID=UPI001EE742F3|nr:LysR family transcriptional regulator [Pantoea dispersa]UKY39053.1 LysR family transcriptional regulator [Pantoea dispersa]
MINSAEYLALRAFVVVAQQLNFRAAAEILGVSASAVSQQITALEAQLGQRLLNRTTRAVYLTDDGKSLFLQTAPIMTNLHETLQQAHARSQDIKGLIRVHAFRSGAEMFLDHNIAGFLTDYPNVQLDITTSDAPVDLSRGGYDLSLRLGEVLEPGFVAIPLGKPLHQIVVAAPAYLAKHGAVEVPEDLLNHNCIGWRWPGSSRVEPWQFLNEGKIFDIPVHGNLVVDDRERQRQAAIAGAGIAQLTAERVSASLAAGKLCRLLQPWEIEFPGYSLCWIAGKAMSPAMRAFIQWLRIK